jgi:hypothetical protein
MVILKMFRVIMVKRRGLKKINGDLEVKKQNVISSKPTIRIKMLFHQN